MSYFICLGQRAGLARQGGGPAAGPGGRRLRGLPRRRRRAAIAVKYDHEYAPHILYYSTLRYSIVRYVIVIVYYLL